MKRFPIVKTVRCEDCKYFFRIDDDEQGCINTNRSGTAENGFDFSKPHICKYFSKRIKEEDKE